MDGGGRPPAGPAGGGRRPRTRNSKISDIQNSYERSSAYVTNGTSVSIWMAASTSSALRGAGGGGGEEAAGAVAVLRARARRVTARPAGAGDGLRRRRPHEPSFPASPRSLSGAIRSRNGRARECGGDVGASLASGPRQALLALGTPICRAHASMRAPTALTRRSSGVRPRPPLLRVCDGEISRSKSSFERMNGGAGERRLMEVTTAVADHDQPPSQTSPEGCDKGNSEAIHPRARGVTGSRGEWRGRLAPRPVVRRPRLRRRAVPGKWRSFWSHSPLSSVHIATACGRRDGSAPRRRLYARR
jgi:hypothetical protein